MTLLAARESLRTAGSQDRWYPWYAGALLVGLVLIPAYWSAILALAPAMAPLGAQSVGLVVAAAGAGVCLIATVSPAYLGPVWTSLEEIHYLILPFGSRAVLGLRTRLHQAAIGAVCAAVVLLPALAWWNGADRPEGTAPLIVAAVIATTSGTTAVFLATRKQRRAGLHDEPEALRLERLTLARDAAMAGAMIGDGRALEGANPRSGPRRGSARFPGGLLARSWAIDVLYTRHDPWRIAAALTALLAASAVLGLAGPSPLTLALLLMTAQASITKLSGALGDVAGTVGYDAVVPQSALRRLGAHLILPLALVLPAAALPVLTLSPSTLPEVSAVVLGALLVRCALLGTSGVPAQWLTPVSTPMGDATAMIMVLWLLRPVLPVAWLLWAGTSYSLDRALGVLLVALAVATGARLRALKRCAVDGIR